MSSYAPVPGTATISVPGWMPSSTSSSDRGGRPGRGRDLARRDDEQERQHAAHAPLPAPRVPAGTRTKPHRSAPAGEGRPQPDGCSDTRRGSVFKPATSILGRGSAGAPREVRVLGARPPRVAASDLPDTRAPPELVPRRERAANAAAARRRRGGEPARGPAARRRRARPRPRGSSTTTAPARDRGERRPTRFTGTACARRPHALAAEAPRTNRASAARDAACPPRAPRVVRELLDPLSNRSCVVFSATPRTTLTRSATTWWPSRRSR